MADLTLISTGTPGRCTGTTGRGTQCTRTGTAGLEGGEPVCGTHLPDERRQARQEAERAARVHAFQSLPADVQAARLRRARFFVTASPACWSWPVPDLIAWDPEVPPVGTGDRYVSEETAAVLRAAYSHPERRAIALLEEWQAGRCAVCESTVQELVTDHDHGTGLVRGLLCRSCNTREGFSYSPQGAVPSSRPTASGRPWRSSG
ncbi:endonuclease domain-containing protein [Streptomyces pseudogriseolus]|uniref:endonuclease domain-containing protein n=1 Tax=Streptomyces pseudogriseolus TaxID=36817 RepID=UPI003FA1B916